MPGLQAKDIPRALTQELPRLKKEFKHIYAVKTKGGVFAIRPLTWSEFLFIQEKINYDPLPESKIVNLALVWPDEIPGDAPAGILHTISVAILDISGFNNPQALQASLAWAEEDIALNPEHNLIMTICKAFPAYKPEDLYKLPFLDLIMRYKMAEKMLGLSESKVDPNVVKQMRQASTVFGPKEEFVPVEVPSPDPLRDPNLAPPDFKRDNAFFRKEFVNTLLEPPHPGE